jgi:hypothetical protein
LVEGNRYALGDLMGTAVEILRNDYGQNAPKPWPRAMKI